MRVMINKIRIKNIIKVKLERELTDLEKSKLKYLYLTKFTKNL